MLIDALSRGVKICETKIKTVYINDNRETHFNPVSDSWAIYKLIFGTFFRYMASSCSSFLIDYGLFVTFAATLKSFPLARRVWCASVAARAISSFCNFKMNGRLVFNYEGSQRRAFARYYLLCAAQIAASAFLVTFICRAFFASEVVVKPAVDCALFFASYHMQRLWIFNAEKEKEKGKQRKCLF